MRRALHALWLVLASRAVTPVVIGIFLLIYIVLAFSTDEALVALIKLTSNTPLLVALLALVPVNRGARLVLETALFMKRRKAMAGVIPPPLAAQPHHQAFPLPLAGGCEAIPPAPLYQGGSICFPRPLQKGVRGWGNAPLPLQMATSLKAGALA